MVGASRKPSTCCCRGLRRLKTDQAEALGIEVWDEARLEQELGRTDALARQATRDRWMS